uniref:Uncharacterized protein n=1 Tax=Arundo donax TaxID=35708 RepID=A0A0A8YYG1_ARUDO
MHIQNCSFRTPFSFCSQTQSINQYCFHWITRRDDMPLGNTKLSTFVIHSLVLRSKNPSTTYPAIECIIISISTNTNSLPQLFGAKIP